MTAPNVIRRIDLRTVALPLIRPYYLSYGVINTFESIQVTVETYENRKQTAEVVPLPGYADETATSLYGYLDPLRKSLAGIPLNEARRFVAKDRAARPFAATALLTAIDLYDYDIPAQTDPTGVAFVKPASTKSLAKLPHAAETLKIKLLGDVEADCRALHEASERLADGPSIRMDANQAYSREAAQQFLKFLSTWKALPRLEYVEQPLKSKDWDGTRILIHEYPAIPIMLDEPIISPEDITRAKDTGAGFVKLKLFKQGGIRELIDHAQLANAQGLRVVLGNGVAGNLSNRIEVKVYSDHRDLFWGACEANGFLKVKVE